MKRTAITVLLLIAVAAAQTVNFPYHGNPPGTDNRADLYVTVWIDTDATDWPYHVVLAVTTNAVNEEVDTVRCTLQWVGIDSQFHTLATTQNVQTVSADITVQGGTADHPSAVTLSCHTTGPWIPHLTYDVDIARTP